MKRQLALLVLTACLAAGCYSAHLDCPCGATSMTATVGGQTALLDALLPLLTKAAGGAIGFGVAGPVDKPVQMCGTVDTSGIDLIGSAVISCASVMK